MGAGQFCTNPGIAVVERGAAGDAFVTAAAEALKGVATQCMLTDGIAAAYRDGKARFDGRNAVRPVYVTDSAGRNANPNLYETDTGTYLQNHALGEEVFGPLGLVVRVEGPDEMVALARGFEGQLTATLHMDAGDAELARRLLPILERKAGRLLANGFPTGVEVADAMVHGGPLPGLDQLRRAPRSGRCRSAASCARSATRTSPRASCPTTCKESEDEGRGQGTQPRGAAARHPLRAAVVPGDAVRRRRRVRPARLCGTSRMAVGPSGRGADRRGRHGRALLADAGRGGRGGAHRQGGAAGRADPRRLRLRHQARLRDGPRHRGGGRRRHPAFAALPDRGAAGGGRGAHPRRLQRDAHGCHRLQPRPGPGLGRDAGAAGRRVPEPRRVQGRHRRHRHGAPHHHRPRRPVGLHRWHADA